MSGVNSDKLLEFLLENIDIKVAIMYGSMVRGDYTPKSDIDIHCFYEGDAPECFNLEFEGRFLDCWLEPMSKLSKINDFSQYMKLKNAKIILDDKQQGERLVQGVRNYIGEGPAQIGGALRNNLVLWLQRTYDRLQRGDDEANYRRVSLLKDILEIFCTLNGMWFFGSKETLLSLRMTHPDFYFVYSEALKDPADLLKIKKVVNLIVGMEIKK
ncbi:nucleotidyltransferase domain-containing protein [Bacteriovorax sp. Seq25_V]|uniref:nucleotidyltransferase domain-containing protein n=1 Tax=Bacteriovorax sp. Seq25_V TaxID=1201288 RepID=UPI00038A30F2|nr:nucleotidyltransferase domain-containing protein [Bacteriovorax sp. Seq25_V]EQC43719.1 nucleotidyltransferase domain protein [Bacteriovorax sp. Seq25_V]